MIMQTQGVSINDLRAAFGVERATAQRDMALLRKLGLTTFEGAPKNGSYQLTLAGRQLLGLPPLDIG